MAYRLCLILILVPFLNGCIGIHQWEATSYDPLSRVGDFPYIFNSFDRASEYADSYDQKLAGTKLRKEHFLYQKVNSILDNIDLAYQSINTGNIFKYYKNKFNFCNQVVNNSALCPKIEINIYALTEPIAISFPNGYIFLSRSIIDGNQCFSIKNIAQLTGLIAHEYIHIKHGHLRYQWAIADVVNSFKESQRRTNWSKIFQYMPIYGYSSFTYSTRELSEISLIDFHLECMADFYTTFLLENMGYSIRDYIELLKGLYSYAKLVEPKNERKIVELQYRIYFLEKLSNMNNITLPAYMAIIFNGQMQDESYVVYSLREYPVLRKYAVYWGFALNEMGKNIMVNDFVLYENNIAFPANTVRYPNTPIDTGNGTVKPLGIVRAISLPYKLVELPIFPFF